MSITFDMSQKEYDILIKFLNDNNGTHIITMLDRNRDDDYTPPAKEKLDKYDYDEGSCEEEEVSVKVDEEGFWSLI